MGARVVEGRRPPRGERVRDEGREDREPLAERARDVRGEADVRDAMGVRLPGKSLKTLQSHAQHPSPVAGAWRWPLGLDDDGNDHRAPPMGRVDPLAHHPAHALL